MVDDLKYIRVQAVLFLLLLLGACPAAAKESFDFTPGLIKAYQDIQKLRFGKALPVLSEERKKSGANGFIPYLESYADFFYFLVADDHKEYNDSFSKKQDMRLQEISALSSTSPYQRMLMAEIRLHSAFVKLKFGNRTGGGWDIIKANRLLAENVKRFPNFIPHLKTLGLLHVMIGSVPDEYQWVTRLMGLKGDISEGLKELATVERESALFAREARVVSLLLQAYILNPDKSLFPELRQLSYREADNLLFHFLSASILMKYGESGAAQAILDKAPQGPEYLSFPFLHYMKAELSLRKGDYEKAQTGYNLFINKTSGDNFVKDAYFKQFICNWLKTGQLNNDLLAEVSRAGSLNTEPDKHAQKIASRFTKGEIAPEQRVLFKARYAFDGGFLKEAEEMLDGLNESSFRLLISKIEYNYRLGRIFQNQGKFKRSIPYLKRTVVLNTGYDFYFGASAALQLGYIYQEMAEPAKAADNFEKAISFKRHEYKNSIDNKARAALTKLREK